MQLMMILFLEHKIDTPKPAWVLSPTTEIDRICNSHINIL